MPNEQPTFTQVWIETFAAPPHEGVDLDFANRIWTPVLESLQGDSEHAVHAVGDLAQGGIDEDADLDQVIDAALSYQ